MRGKAVEMDAFSTGDLNPSFCYHCVLHVFEEEGGLCGGPKGKILFLN